MPWKQKMRSPIFEGDVAIKELRARLALAPEQMPEPPLYRAGDPIFAVVARLVGVMALAGVGALGFFWITTPHGAPPDSQAAGQPVGASAPVSYRNHEASQRVPAAEIVRTGPAPEAPASRSPWTVADHARDLTDGVGTPPSAPAPLAAVAVPATTRSVAPVPRVPVVPAVGSLPPPAAAPVPVAPQVAVPAAAPTAAPVPLPPPASASDRDEIAALHARARAYMFAGDVASARLVLRRAVERGDATAALSLGESYDPMVLKQVGGVNFNADPAQARDWYRKAAELGSADAPLRLEQLAEIDR